MTTTLANEVAASAAVGQIPIHSAEGFAAMRRAGQLTARCLDMLTESVRPGSRYGGRLRPPAS